MAAMASTTGTALGNTHGSWRPRAFRVVGLPSRSRVSCSCKIVATGLNAIRKYISCPLLIPPCMPPLWFVAVSMLPSWFTKRSFCSLPKVFTQLKPSPYSKPFTAFMPSIALPNCACSLSNSGSPSPAGQPFITHVMIPPTVLPSALTLAMRFSISLALSLSGQRTILLSVSERSYLV